MLESMVDLATYEAATDDAGREAAISLARENASRYPLSRTLADDYADLLQRSGHHALAVAWLRDQLALPHSDPEFWRLLAASQAALGHQTLEHQATAEMYLLEGARGPAMEQFKLARSAADADFYTMSEVDARLRELNEQINEEKKASGRHREDSDSDGKGKKPLADFGR